MDLEISSLPTDATIVFAKSLRPTAISQLLQAQATGAYSGDGSAATSATFNFPTGVAVDGVGNLFIADTLNQVIRKVSAADGVITTVAGNRSGTYSGDGTLATNASIFQPSGLTLDGAGNLYIADTGNTTSGSTATTTVNVVDIRRR